MIDQRATVMRRMRYDRIAPFYDLMELMGSRRSSLWYEKLWAGVPPTRVLEVGVGTGINFEYYPKGARVIGIDFSPRMLERARTHAAKVGRSIELRQMDVQAMEFPGASFDAAVATCVFCSVPDPVLGLREVKRVVKPGGRVFLVEHMGHSNPTIGAIQDVLNPLVRWMGPDINRRTLDNIRTAGLEIEHVEDLGMGGIFKLIVARVPTEVESENDEHFDDELSLDGARRERGLRLRSRKLGLPITAGLLGALFLAGLYLGIVTLAQGWDHAIELFRQDKFLVVPIIVGFGIQVGLYTFIRTGLHATARGMGTMTGAGGGTSTVAMVACCTHHIADVLPILGLTAAATFLAAYRITFMLVGLSTTLLGIGMMLVVIARERRRTIQVTTPAKEAV